MSSSQTHPISPELFFETINAHQRSAALAGALDLGLFTAIGEGNSTAAEIAARCEASERGTRILCDYLTIVGFLTKTDDHCGLSPDSAAFLDRRSPAYVGNATRFLLSPTLRHAFDDIATVVRTGTTMLPDDGTVTNDNSVWVDFAR